MWKIIDERNEFFRVFGFGSTWEGSGRFLGSLLVEEVEIRSLYIKKNPMTYLTETTKAKCQPLKHNAN